MPVRSALPPRRKQLLEPTNTNLVPSLQNPPWYSRLSHFTILALSAARFASSCVFATSRRSLLTMSSSSSSSSFDDITTRLFARSPIPPLEPGKKVYDAALTQEIKNCGEHKYVVAALHLANDDIENCHLIAQDNEGDATADLLHATLHRREGDYWNSKYWWSHIRSHPTIKSSADAKSFVDACEKEAGSNSPGEMKLRERQWEDLKKLVSWTREYCK